MRRLPVLTALLMSIGAHADPMSDAFSKGAAFGNSNNAAIRSNIQNGTAQSALPSSTANVPQANYFGSGGIDTQAAGTINACAEASTDPNKYNDQACRAVNFSQTNPTAHAQFNLQPSDPLFAKARSITNDPAAIAGNIAGTYSGCTTQTTTSPDIYQSQFCTSYRALQQPVCKKTLTVTVADNGLNCTFGSYVTPNPRIAFIRPFVFVGAICAEDIRFQWIWGYSECNGTNAPQFRTTVIPSDTWQVVGVSLPCGGFYDLWGSCTNGNCSYAVGSIYDTFVCNQYDYNNPSCDDGGCSYPCLQGQNQTVYAALAGFNWQRPVHTFTITDAWNDQCATYEARLP